MWHSQFLFFNRKHLLFNFALVQYNWMHSLIKPESNWNSGKWLSEKSDRYSYSEQSDNWREMFTGHDWPTAMNVYWSVGIFSSDRTSRPVGSSVPAYYIPSQNESECTGYNWTVYTRLKQHSFTWMWIPYMIKVDLKSCIPRQLLNIL